MAARQPEEALCGGTGLLVKARFRAAIIALAVVAGVGCGRAMDGTDDAPRFDDSAPSLDALGKEVLTSLTRADTARLERYRLTEHEHNDVVWPELPASAPEVNFPIDYAWLNIVNRNQRGLARIIPQFADRGLGFQDVQCRGETEGFASFSVHTDCWIVFSADGSPELWEAQIFKDVLERGGGFKIFRYYDAEPHAYRGAARP
jgi:hypothetical protein